MKIHESGDGVAERRALTAMITDDVVLGRISPKWDADQGLFRSTYANQLANLTVKYYRDYGKSPGLHISELFSNWAEANYDKTIVEMGERFLTALNDEHDPNAVRNSEFTINQTAEHFRKVQVRRLIDAVKSDLDANQIEIAESRLNAFSHIDLGSGKSVDVLRDTEAMRRAFADQSEDPLIYLPGAYGDFFGRTLDRSMFVAFFAAMKKKKTFFLIDIAWRAMLSRLKVAFFEVGDLTEPQIMGRFGCRATRRPRWPTKPGKPVRWPTGIRMPPADDMPANVEWQEQHFAEPLGWRDAYRACKDIISGRLHSKDEFLKLVTVPARTMSALMIRDQLEYWSRVEGFEPDCVLIDYIDLLDPIDKREEGRDRVNTTWLALNALRQDRNCLVLTATQTNAKSFDAVRIDYSHFAEDNRKLAHLTAAVGISESKAEKELGVTRLNMFINRNEEFDQRRDLHCAGCVAVSNPVVKSIW